MKIQLFFVNPTGKMSNFLAEDFDAVLKFMDTETQNRKNKHLH